MASSSKGIRAGRAFVELFGDDSKLQKTLRDASNKLGSWGKSITAVGTSVMVAGAAAIAPLAIATKTFADSGSALNDMAARTGASVESLSSLGFAAGMTGASIEDLETALKKTSKLVTEAREGNKGAAESLAKLGLSADKLAGLKPEDQFREIAKRVAAIKDPAVASANAMGLWGKSGTSLIPLAKNMGELEARAKSLGIVMSTEDAEAADALGDAIDELTALAKAATNQVGAALAPALTELAGSAATAGASIVGWIRDNREAIVTAAKVAAGVVVAGVALVALGQVFAVAAAAVTATAAILGGIVAVVGAVGAAIAFLVTPLGLALAALTAAGLAFVAFTDAGFQAAMSVSGWFQEMSGVAKTAIDAITTALKAGKMGAAANVLWAALKLAWTTGTGGLWSAWSQFLADMVSAMTQAGKTIAGKFVDVVTEGAKQMLSLEDAAKKLLGQKGRTDQEKLFQEVALAGMNLGAKGKINTALSGVDEAFQGGAKDAVAKAEADAKAARAAFDAAVAEAKNNSDNPGKKPPLQKGGRVPEISGLQTAAEHKSVGFVDARSAAGFNSIIKTLRPNDAATKTAVNTGKLVAGQQQNARNVQRILKHVEDLDGQGF